jgi:DNA replication protein DnaC
MPKHVSDPEKSNKCPLGICDGSGFIIDLERGVADPCECQRARTQRRIDGLSTVIPSRYRGLSFDRPPIANISKPVLRQVRRYVRQLEENLQNGQGLWFSGDVGTGKTSLAMLVSQSALSSGHTVAIYSVPRLLAEIRTTFDQASERSYVDLLDKLTQIDLLHLDDLGAEKTSPWVLEQLYTIINGRYEDQRAMLVTTNLSRDEIVEQIGARTVSRLEEMCALLPLFGEDRRARDPRDLALPAEDEWPSLRAAT